MKITPHSIKTYLNYYPHVSKLLDTKNCVVKNHVNHEFPEDDYI